jgi:hypothetical protein
MKINIRKKNIIFKIVNQEKLIKKCVYCGLFRRKLIHFFSHKGMSFGIKCSLPISSSAVKLNKSKPNYA